MKDKDTLEELFQWVEELAKDLPPRPDDDDGGRDLGDETGYTQNVLRELLLASKAFIRKKVKAGKTISRRQLDTAIHLLYGPRAEGGACTATLEYLLAALRELEAGRNQVCITSVEAALGHYVLCTFHMDGKGYTEQVSKDFCTLTEVLGLPTVDFGGVK